MSDNDSGTPAAASGAAFTERELQMLGWAMQSLKTGPPEIDYEKLAAFAGMSNPRSAGNAWAKIKTKLMVNPDGTAIPTPKKAPAARKKAGAAKDDGEDGSASPTKKVATPRKRAAKKQEVEGGDASPKKKGRGAAKKEEAKINAEETGEDDLKPEVAAEENVEDEV